MTRKEGILKRINEPENARILAAAKGDIQALLKTEYQNYSELCYYCYEDPLPMNKWLYEKIKPAKN